VKAASRVPIRALERLERAAGKLARRVLRGGGDSNAASLPNILIISQPRQVPECSRLTGTFHGAVTRGREAGEVRR